MKNISRTQILEQRQAIEAEFGSLFNIKKTKGSYGIRRLIKDKHKRNCLASWDVPPLSDHYDLWIRNGKPVCFTSQPYGPLNINSIKQITRYADEHELDFEIRDGSWHFPGWTILIIWTAKGVVLGKDVNNENPT